MYTELFSSINQPWTPRWNFAKKKIFFSRNSRNNWRLFCVALPNNPPLSMTRGVSGEISGRMEIIGAHAGIFDSPRWLRGSEAGFMKKDAGYKWRENNFMDATNAIDPAPSMNPLTVEEKSCRNGRPRAVRLVVRAPWRKRTEANVADWPARRPSGDSSRALGDARWQLASARRRSVTVRERSTISRRRPNCHERLGVFLLGCVIIAYISYCVDRQRG